jgi:hypothetical protein
MNLIIAAMTIDKKAFFETGRLDFISRRQSR